MKRIVTLFSILLVTLIGFTQGVITLPKQKTKVESTEPAKQSSTKEKSKTRSSSTTSKPASKVNSKPTQNRATAAKQNARSSSAKQNKPSKQSNEPTKNEEPEVTYADTETISVNGVSFKMIFVKNGTFMMGDDNIKVSSPKHSEYTLDFYLGETEVTQQLWKAVMGTNPSDVKVDLNPVTNISWEECYQFIAKLNKLTGRHFRLPYEYEWEFAAAGGVKSSHEYKYSGSDVCDDVAWNSFTCKTPQPVATKKPNELGIYDMSGNVCEFTASSASNNYESEIDYDYITTRGGSHNSLKENCDYRHRVFMKPTAKANDTGFRLAEYADDDFNPTLMDMVTVDGGSYMMGNSEYGFHGELVKPFNIMSTEVTQIVWFHVFGRPHKSYNSESFALPLTTLSWEECQKFIKKLNMMTCHEYRLPTELEWEYAARGGKKGISNGKSKTYSGSDTPAEVAWYKENGDGKTHDVAGKEPNELTLYDMSGNAYEFTADSWCDKYADKRDDTCVAIRGGSYVSDTSFLKCDSRFKIKKTDTYKDIGFRLVETIK
jgi:formylglycine-generating enzyme required for sulfatase activity